MVEWFLDEKFIEVQIFLGLIHNKKNKNIKTNFFNKLAQCLKYKNILTVKKYSKLFDTFAN